MRKLLITTTALSMAITSVPVLPLGAQTLTPEGAVIAEDGTILCSPTPDAACDLKAIKREANKAARKAEKQAENEAAKEARKAEKQAENEAAKEARKAEKAAAAEAEAQAEAARQAEADAQAEAAKKAERQAAKAAAQAEAEAEAKARAKAAEKAAAKAAADAEAEAAAAAAAAAAAVEEAERATADEAKRAEKQAARKAEKAAQEQAEQEKTLKEREAQDLAEKQKSEEEAKAARQAARKERKAAEAAAEEAAEAEEPVKPLGKKAREEQANVVPVVVDAPVPQQEEVKQLESLLSRDAADKSKGQAAVEDNANANAAAAADKADRAERKAGRKNGKKGKGEGGVVKVETQKVEAEDTRSSEEEFKKAPVQVAEGKKSGLSDLERVGLVALGALAVGTIINGSSKAQQKVVSNSGDRVIVENPDGTYSVYKDDDAVLRRPGVETYTESYADGSTRTVVTRPDGSEVVTVRDASGRVLKRSSYDARGVETVLIDDLYREEPIIISELPKPRPERLTISTSDRDAELRAALAAEEAAKLGRRFSLRQIRDVQEVRALAPTVEVDSITFDTGSSAIRASEASKLADLGQLMQRTLAQNPAAVFLIEGHTDAVGSASSNLLLSDRRAKSLALALTEYFGVAPENLVVQGYGESELKVQSLGDERANRRVVVRLISPLMRTAER